ncbi:MAG: hypothetical protein HC937_02830 [Aquincola sp.]|nr:hypothetical protein [Aquincola sp.]
MALPKWVKLWLFALNGVFLAAPLFLETADWRIVFIAYVATGRCCLATQFMMAGCRA